MKNRESVGYANNFGSIFMSTAVIVNSVVVVVVVVDCCGCCCQC